jgi:hypothetical protein
MDYSEILCGDQNGPDRLNLILARYAEPATIAAEPAACPPSKPEFEPAPPASLSDLLNRFGPQFEPEPEPETKPDLWVELPNGRRIVFQENLFGDEELTHENSSCVEFHSDYDSWREDMEESYANSLMEDTSWADDMLWEYAKDMARETDDYDLVGGEALDLRQEGVVMSDAMRKFLEDEETCIVLRD